MSYQDLKKKMVSHLKKSFRGMVDDGAGMNFSIESAIYWFANDYHNGGGSELYQILSTSKFRPGPSVKSVADEGDEIDKMMYEELERHFIPKGKAMNNGRSSARKNPPSFVLVDKSTGEVVYTKRATGMGTEAINKCVWAGRARAHKTGRTYFVFLDIGGLRVGQKISVSGAYAMGITEEIIPELQREAPKLCLHCGASYIGTEQMHKFECPPQGGGKGMYKENPRGGVRKNIFAFNNPPSGPGDSDAAHELELYIENDAKLYRQQYLPIIKNLMLKRRKGIYNRELAIKLFMYLVDNGARNYVLEHGTGRMDSMYNKNTRLMVARSLRDYFETEAKLGNYDRLIGPVSNPGRVQAFYCHCGRRVELEGRDTQCEKCGQWYNSFGQRLKDPSRWSGAREHDDELDNPRNYYSKGVREAVQDAINRQLEFKGKYIQGGARAQILKRTDNLVIGHEMSPHEAAYQAVTEYVSGVRRNPGVRKNIFAFNNPRKLNALEQAAAAVGLYVTTWAPGDGLTRYRFHTKPADYSDGSAIYTANGRKEAIAFIKSYGIGRSRMNPSNGARCSSACSNPSHPHGALNNPYARGRERRSYQDLLARARAQHGSKFDSSDLDPRFVQYYENGKRIWVNDFGHVASGTVGCTTGWRPCFLLMSSVRAMGSSTLLTSKTKILGEVGVYKPRRGQYGEPVENPARILPNPLLQTIMLANPGSVKTFNETQDVGKAKYVVNYHDGVKVHRDGSPFFDIAIFSSQVKKDQFVRKLESLGFTRGTLRNPPISAQWDKMTTRQRIAVMNAAGYEGGYAVNRTWKQLDASIKSNIEKIWLDTSSRGGTTKRRRAVSVGANPLTRKESGKIIRSARRSIEMGGSFRPGHTRSALAGKAIGKAHVVSSFGPRSARAAAGKIHDRAQKLAGTTMSNPGVSGIRFPKSGTKLTVEQAMALAHKVGDRELIRQCKEAMRLQTKANRGTKCVVWKTLPIGSPNKIDMVTAFAHYGDSPEDMYKAPKGSKKGPHMYRHKWGDGTGKTKPVPVLAAPSGKAIIKLMGPGQKVGDWMRG